MNRELIARCSEVPKEEGLIVKLSTGQEIALFQWEGAFYAVENACPHQGGPLGEGFVDQGCISCPWHGWEFDLATGACINHPSSEAKKIPIAVEGDQIFWIKSS